MIPKHQQHNLNVFTKLGALIEKLEHGVLDLSMTIYDKRVVNITVYGKKRKKYKGVNMAVPAKDILQRLKTSIDRNENTDIVFAVKVRSGKIRDVLWKVDMNIDTS